MSLNEELLVAFDAVVRHGSVGKAAVALNSTQPTISRHIRALEHRLGQPLFERDASGMHLTAAGLDLLPRARHILDEFRLTHEAMDGHRGLRRGTIRVGGVTSLVRSFLPPIVAEVLRRAPQLQVEVVVGSEEQLDRALARRELDIIFATQPPRDVEAVEIGSASFRDRSLPFCASGHPLLAGPTPDVEAVLQQEWALGHLGATTRMQFEGLVAAAGHPVPRVALQTDSVDVIIAVVSQSTVMGWLPEPILENSGRRAAITPLPLPELELVRTFRAYRRSRGSFSPGGQVFIDAMAASATV